GVREHRQRAAGDAALLRPGRQPRRAERGRLQEGKVTRGVGRAERGPPASRNASMKKLSIGSWAYIFNQEKPTTDFHEVLHKLQHLGYDGVELGSFGAHPTPNSHPTRADRQRLKKEVADHGLEFSGIAVDLWGFKKPGPSILDENPTPYMAAFLGFTVFGHDLGIKTIRVDSVEPPDFFQKSGMDPQAGLDRILTVWDKCSKIAADYGMNICWEFEPGFLFNKPSEILKIVDGVR